MYGYDFTFFLYECRMYRDLNETWFIDRWQYEEGQCTITIILPCIFTELSPHNYLFFIIDACPGHILESTKGIEVKLGL